MNEVLAVLQVLQNALLMFCHHLGVQVVLSRVNIDTQKWASEEAGPEEHVAWWPDPCWFLLEASLKSPESWGKGAFIVPGGMHVS